MNGQAGLSGASSSGVDLMRGTLLQGEQSAPSLLEVEDLRKSFTLRPVLRGITLSLQVGERVALLGSNGAGKTTLLRVLATLTKPSAGSFRLAGLDGERDAQEVRSLVGLVAHQSYLYEELSVVENLRFFARMYGVSHAQVRIQSLLERVGLERRQRERVSVLSRGQVQRLAWARALLHAPRLLLLDEPETGLDQEGRRLTAALLDEYIAQQGTCLFTTHHLEHALQASERIVLLSAGRIAYQAATNSLDLAALQHIYQEVVR